MQAAMQDRTTEQDITVYPFPGHRVVKVTVSVYFAVPCF